LLDVETEMLVKQECLDVIVLAENGIANESGKDGL
jgi:hypothetical protein